MPRLITEASPLANLPADLNAIQRGWIEGLRYSIEICDLTYQRLRACLLAISNRQRDEPASREDLLSLRVAAFADAWTFVDAVWRLKRILLDRTFPLPVGVGPTDTSDQTISFSLKEFRAAIAQVKSLRDSFQHIDDHIARNDLKDKLVWGHLTWYVVYPADKRVDVCMLVAGTMPRSSMNFDVVDTRGGRFRAPIDRVSLIAFGARVELKPIHDAISQFVRDFEGILEPQFAGCKRESDGVLMKMCLRFEQMGPASSVEK